MYRVSIVYISWLIAVLWLQRYYFFAIYARKIAKICANLVSRDADWQSAQYKESGYRGTVKRRKMPTGSRCNTKNTAYRAGEKEKKEKKRNGRESYKAQICSAIELRATQSAREMCFFEGSYSHGERISTRPAATASKRASEGL